LKDGVVSDRSHLEEITIRNLGVIEEAVLDFGPGFTVLTGETGAGKTMILTALSLVLGGRSDATLVRQGRDRLIVSGSFRVPSAIEEIASEKGAAVDEGTLILTRTINADGKSKSSAGGVAVPLGLLSELSDELIEIHAQAASMSITKSNKQREILDRYGGKKLTQAVEKYFQTFEAYFQLKSRISLLRRNAAEREKEIKALSEFADAFNKVKPLAGEMTALEQEISRLDSIEELRKSVAETDEILNEDERGVITLLGQIRRSLDGVQSKDPLVKSIAETVTEGFFLLSDASHSVRSYLQDLEADPERLEAAHLRRAAINLLLKRFGTLEDPDEQIADLIKRNKEVKNSIEDLSGGDERLAKMEEELKRLYSTMGINSLELSTVRREVAEKLSFQISQEIHSLSMPHTEFHCQVTSPDYSGLVPTTAFTASGADEVAMLLQGHSGGPLVPLAKGASGGEMSRVMLALEVVLAQSQPVGTYVFDEVDAGVGGKAAIEVGRRLYELSKHAQVIVVTHLPQVAAWADSHFVVRKNDSGSVSQSDVSHVVGVSRVEEIARMLAGHEDSRSAQEHAAELLAMRVPERGL
jgi:DNA repair protein RecN (Recombination protein N)